MTCRPRRSLRNWGRRVLYLSALALLVWVGERAASLADPFPIDLLERFPESRQVTGRDGTLLRLVPTTDGERRVRLPLHDFSPHVVRAVLAAEDHRFGNHSGVDFLAVVRAGFTSVMRGRIVSGASTLHMQLSRIVEPHARTIGGKLHEMRRARQLARVLDAEAVLEAYLNLVPMGGTLRGFPVASLRWFGKSARDLAPQEAATLAAMLPAPSRRRPDRATSELRLARDRILDAMRDCDDLDTASWHRAKSAPLVARAHPWPWHAPHFADLALRTDDRTRITTSIEPEFQRTLHELVQRERPAGVDGVCIVVLERTSQEVVALVGSRSWRESQVNAAMARRSAGSTLKPFIYALALEAGAIGFDALVADTPVTFRDYAPANFDKTWSGPVRVSDALVRSRNAPAVRILRVVGVSRFRDLLRSIGLDSGDRALHLDAALGTVAVTPLALARAYCRFADLDERIPHVSASVRARVLEVLRQTSPDVATCPEGVVAWKTGTSSGRRDAWCVGVTDRHVIVTWLGNLRGRGSADLVGARSAGKLLASAASFLDRIL